MTYILSAFNPRMGLRGLGDGPLFTPVKLPTATRIPTAISTVPSVSRGVTLQQPGTGSKGPSTTVIVAGVAALVLVAMMSSKSSSHGA